LVRFMFASYATVPVYEAFFRWLGHGEQIDEMVEAWAARDRERAAAAAPWDLIEEIFLFGTPDEIRERVGEFVEAGVTLPIMLPVGPPERMGGLIDALGPG
jgi:alkanesulfonate monooxygenase SsuD/methylene tetrahydromethanopterin reductase-like flavin-dependent oxidoreductase (luciferase family)